MKKYQYITLLLLSCVLVFSACRPEDPLLKEARANALNEKVLGVFDKGKSIFSYDASKHQLAYNTEALMCRIQTDDTGKVLQMTLDAVPEVGATRNLTMKTKGLPSVASQCKVEILKIEDDKVWMLDHETLIYYVMYYPAQ